MEKQAVLAEVILHHMYYSTPGRSSEAVVFRDADTIDGLGAVGAVRVFSTGGREDGWAPSLREGLERVTKWQTDLPQALSTATARAMARERVEELRGFLDRLQEESAEGKAL
jgi:HD superfamily phosphodiesterase